MITQHTPGPWWETESGVRDRGGLICHTISPQRYPGQEDRFERETIERAANKNLISAAPDMYEALKSIVEDHDFCGDDWGDRRDAWIETARTVLAKAEGKS